MEHLCYKGALLLLEAGADVNSIRTTSVHHLNIQLIIINYLFSFLSFFVCTKETALHQCMFALTLREMGQQQVLEKMMMCGGDPNIEQIITNMNHNQIQSKKTVWDMTGINNV